MSRTIFLLSSPVMRQPCREVSDFGPGLQQRIRAVHACMVRHREHALSANQAGFADSMVLVNTSPDMDESTLQVFINPRIISSSSTQHLFTESCPSEPGKLRQRRRAIEVVIHYQDARGAGHTVIARNDLAVYLQHTMEHLVSDLAPA